MTGTDPDELGEALTRVKVSRTRNAEEGLDGTVGAVATLAVDATAKAINTIIMNSSGLCSP